MRVGIYTFRIKERPTGLANYAIHLTRAMAKVDPELELFLLTPYRESPLAWYSEFPTCFVGATGSSEPIDFALAPLAMRRVIKRLKLDVVHAPGNFAPFPPLGWNVARAVTVHDLAPLAFPEEHRLVSRLGHRGMAAWLRFAADAVLTVSESSANDLVRLAHVQRDRIHVTPNGVDLPGAEALERWKGEGIPELGLERGSRYFLCIDGFRKNVAGSMAAFSRILVKQPAVKMVMVGRGKRGTDAAAAAEMARIGSALIAPGYVSDGVLHRLYAGALALVMPSLSEGFGLPALEAMAHGTLPIVSDLPVLTELVGDAGIAVDPNSTDAIAGAMESVMNMSEESARARAKTRSRASAYTWAKTAAKTLDVYRRIIAERDHRRS